jgi:hypothetical protein
MAPKSTSSPREISPPSAGDKSPFVIRSDGHPLQPEPPPRQGPKNWPAAKAP